MAGRTRAHWVQVISNCGVTQVSVSYTPRVTSMTLTLILVAAALLLAALLLRSARGHAQMIRELPQLEGLTRPVDLAAFRNLIDPAEEDYLRLHLPPGRFRAIQRERLRAALEYVRRTAYNGAILLRIGEAARRDHNPEVAAAGRDLVTDALRLRLNAKLATVVLYGRILIPDARISVGRITDAYENLAQGLARLARLRDPAYATRVSALV